MAELATELFWSAVAKAVDQVKNGEANRIEGIGWKVYHVGNIVRVDIRDEHD